LTKIGIVGLGLIGGSLGLDLRVQGIEVVGVSRRQTTCDTALIQGVVDKASTELSILAGTEIVFLCTPLAAIAATLEAMIPYLDSQTVVTDVGSVKAPIVEACSPLWPNFVGGHPMAGTAQQGIEAAQTNLFQQAAYVLTPTASTPPEAVKQVEKIGQLLGSNIYTCSPEIHDRAVAWISHLPVMVSAALIEACMSEEDREVVNLAKNLASSGFRDTSRVGGGNVELGLMMAKYNRQLLLSSLEQYRQSLDKIITQIEQENWQDLEKILQSTHQARPDFLN
jgi:arogenate dehydrogenase (NADP+)